MKVDMNLAIQAFVGAAVIGGGAVGWNLNQTVTKLDLTVTRIAPIVEQAAKMGNEVSIRVGVLEEDCDDMDDRLRALESK